jgi:hypothetical protein
MSSPSTPPGDPVDLADEVRRLKERVSRLEAYLRLEERAAPTAQAAPAAPAESGEDLEFRLGQEWFAKIGIGALAAGIAFTLTLPFEGAPAVFPSLVGFALAGATLGLAVYFRLRMEQLVAPLKGAAMFLSFIAAVRLCYFGQIHVLDAGSVAGCLAMTLAAAVNVALGLRSGSSFLSGLGLATGFGAAVTCGAPPASLALLLGFTAVAAWWGVRRLSPATILPAVPLAYLAYALLAFNDPLAGRPLMLVAPWPGAPFVLLACLAVLSLALLRASPDRSDATANVGIFLNASIGGLLYLFHTLEAYESWLVAYQAVAAAVLIALGLVHSRRSDRVGAFICAMSGFLALTLAILKLAPVPDVFVWLSLQSVVVVATAIWLRSRFIIVANFLIYLGILASYILVAEAERGISVGFGVVALVTAHLLAWKQQQLELKTGFMRNAYMAAAFAVFPYALAHLLPSGWVALAWAAAALGYYCLAAVLHEAKYRWMAHATLVLAVGYLVVAAISRLDPFLRTLSFLVLGVLLVVVSFVFSQARRRRRH